MIIGLVRSLRVAIFCFLSILDSQPRNSIYSMLGTLARITAASSPSRTVSIRAVDSTELFRSSTKLLVMVMGALKWLRHNFRSSRKPLRAVIISSTKWCVVFLVQSVTCSTISRDCKLTVVDANRCKPGILILWQHASCKCIKCFIEPKASNKASSTRSIASSSSNSTLGLVCNIRMIDLVGMLRMTLKSYVPRMRKRQMWETSQILQCFPACSSDSIASES